MENFKLDHVFLTIINDGTHYSRQCDVARRTPAERFWIYSNIVSETIRQGHNSRWWNKEDFSFDEIFEIVKALDDYHQNHLKESQV